MSADQLAAFVEEAKSNTELQEKLKSVTSAEAAIEIAKEAGFSITSEDIQTMQSATPSDKELEDAAGGTTIVVPIMATVIACPFAISYGLRCLD